MLTLDPFPQTVFTSVISTLLEPLLLATCQISNWALQSNLLSLLDGVIFHSEHAIHFKTLLLSENTKEAANKDSTKVTKSYPYLLFDALSKMLKAGKTAAVLNWLPHALESFLNQTAPVDADGTALIEQPKKKQKMSPKLGVEFSFLVKLLDLMAEVRVKG